MDDPFQASLRPRRSLHMLTHFYGFGYKDVTFQGRVEGGDRNPWRYHPSQLRGKAIRREAGSQKRTVGDSEGCSPPTTFRVKAWVFGLSGAGFIPCPSLTWQSIKNDGYGHQCAP